MSIPPPSQIAKPQLDRLLDALNRGDKPTLAGVPDGFDAVVLADLTRARAKKGEGPALLVFIARDGQRLQVLENALQFVAPDLEVMSFPAWDCQPYDRVSPAPAIVAHRMTTLSRLAKTKSGERPRLLLTTVNAALQRVPAFGKVASESFSAAPGNMVDIEELARWLDINGYLRTSTVRETGEFAVRGGIVDLFPPGMPAPIRLDFFGDTLESIRTFDPETQRTTGQLRGLDLVPMSEAQMTSESIRRFRQSYISTFGTPGRDDTLYEAVSEGRRPAGLEHWLPLLAEKLDTLFTYLPDVPLVLDHQAEDAVGERISLIKDYYDARKAALEQGGGGGIPYKPLPPDALYLSPGDWRAVIDGSGVATLTPFHLPDSEGKLILDLGGKQGRSFAAERAGESGSVFEAAVAHVRALEADGRRVILAAWSEGSRERLAHVLEDHGLKSVQMTGSLRAAFDLKPGTVALAVWGFETGFEAGRLAVIGEQDILGDRLVRPRRKTRRPQDFIAELSSLAPGDLVVHVDHGIGRFIGLQSITAAGAPHDCLEIHYAGDSKLFLPVENIELLSRYGSEDTEVQLDRLGGGGWQARKAKLKQRIREMAGKLIQIAAARALKEAPRLVPPAGVYDEFIARFPYEETEDQQNTIDAVLDDLAAGRPMDRLVCGDVGFGKTEVALRAAFATALNGKQVAVVVPTTLLARQHYRNFADRFAGLPVNVGQASRFVGSADLKAVKQGARDGTMDIVVGTHALLGKGVDFKDLGLVIVDEEQHFGVAHKEKLKEMRAEVHMLTLTATPIPRTLQLAMTGVRELSIIATPPVDRLAVRTFVTPFDPLIVREALLRERYRGGRSFYVVPRIEDIADVKDFLDKQVPECKVGIAHGQMAAGTLEDVMTAFYEGQYDILLSTTIVESGLDIPTANTLIVHRADMFGLAQLYQLRGRVGRSKTRAYALFTVPANRKLTEQADKRLKVLQSLDTLGAGFQLASHDLDIRGAGNLLGDEQSGHIKEVGYELYQQMLEEAVAALKAGIEFETETQWSPAIQVGAPVMIPEHYVADLTLRLTLYKRLSTMDDDGELQSFGAELVDRFGPLPEEVNQLLEIVAIKALCKRANVEKVEAGPKGIIVAFRNNEFANPEGLVGFVAKQGTLAKVRPDMRVVFIDDFDTVEQRLKATRRLLTDLARIAERKKAA
ncbi:MAG: transcription-repair coupling factor [Bosea sp.]|uniref:transcription-repair coupling factor n=1 Tax=unclassified Bosea (in: a-proteobacteria) TaxID=2653178 RepID=UPI00095FEBF8|nr:MULTISPECIES: transcription-repair coupling factor [unclassified Bosea (in: a-proteobacteria)]MBN9457435.1 transcription-repair coupling factor [Bosea sp. (in: a-proteobacteria)]OJV09590.1 MAG: transcription-repair coupling factor [Bosea sp. 67-29]